MTKTIATLTTKQRAVLDAILAHRAEHGASPTYQELGDQLGVALATAQEHVGNLVDMGFLVKAGESWRQNLVPTEAAVFLNHAGEAMAVIQELAQATSKRGLEKARAAARRLLAQMIETAGEIRAKAAA